MGRGQRGPRVIVVDSSAIAAILFDEPGAAELTARLSSDTERVLSAASYLEVGTVLAGRRRTTPAKAQRDLDDFLEEAHIVIAPVDENQARLALRARIEYGRGFGVRGGLNYGDCFAYALAKSLDAPLLFVGDDFARCDVTPALVSHPARPPRRS
jgi:ribonuclease VapC